MPKTILHITDMHIDDPSDNKEPLGKKNYKEYITQFSEKIRQNNYLPNCIVATGDFIDKGNINNFDHAKDVLFYLAKKLDLSYEKIAVCCGNHDRLLEEDKKNNTIAARKHFKEFSQFFVNKTSLITTDRASLCKLCDDIYVLILDSTLGSKVGDRPGSISNKEVNCIINNIILDKFESNSLLIVCSHYPLATTLSHFLVPQDPEWVEKHIWKGKAGELYSRIIDSRSSKQTLWLYGDIHHPDGRILQRGSYFVTTGNFGPSNIKSPRQGRIIRIYNKIENKPGFLTLEYNQTDYKSKKHHWDFATATARQFNENLEFGDLTITNQSKQKEKIISKFEPMSQEESKIELLDDELEKELISKIEEKKLYTLGRFHTSEGYISLSWVSIGPLLNSRGLVPFIVEKMSLWLNTKYTKYKVNKEDIILLGMDCWGSVLASELTVFSGIKNYCIGVRGRGLYHTSNELIDQNVAHDLMNYKILVFICDVLATGHSIKFVFEDIQKKWEQLKKEEKIKSLPENNWFCLSIIMDEKNTHRINCDFIKIYGTACKNLRMPIVLKDDFPDETILPNTISFS